MYLYCLSDNYNNPSLAVGVGNDSQNGIHCCRRAVIHNILTKLKTCFASHFDGHADQAVRCQVHRPVRQVFQASIHPVLPRWTPWSSILA
jgi:hypothetical protein